MHFAYTAPLPSHVPAHLAGFALDGDAGLAAFFLAFAALVVFTALSGARVAFASPLDARHRGQVEPIIASGGPVTAAIKAGRAPRPRCPVTGRFVKVAR
jgi:hypothetical protein